MRQRRYRTAAALEKAVNAYFLSITRRKAVTEKIDTGMKDKDGHTIWEERTVHNQLGEPVILTQYLVPPQVAGLCEFLRIHRSTWANYSDPQQHPEFAAVTEAARDRMRAWNERELLTREGKDVRGIIFNLQNNYGYTEKSELEMGARAGEILLRIADDSDGLAD